MPAFPKPKKKFSFIVKKEIENLRKHRDTSPGRKIPDKHKDRLLLATWNIANLGLQKREADHYKLLAEMISWFDIVSLQEVNDNLDGLRSLQKFLPASWKVLFSDKSGNNERMTFLFDADKLSVMEKIGEISIPPEEYKDVKIAGIKTKFTGFDRSPYIGSFKIKNFEFVLVNVHLYFGSEKKSDSMDRRCLETYCVARWADLRRNSKYAYSENIIALGDFNLPKVNPSDPVFKALSSKGMILPEHSCKIYSNIADDKDYDQIAFFPGLKEELTGNSGVFDFDYAIFPDLFKKSAPQKFKEYIRYYISDHRPKWVELKV